MTIVAALMTVFFIMQLVGQVPAALWVIFGEDRFRWSATMIGLSLAVFGILHALAQAFVTGPATKRFGEKQAIIAGMAADALGYVLLAFEAAQLLGRAIGAGLFAITPAGERGMCCKAIKLGNARVFPVTTL